MKRLRRLERIVDPVPGGDGAGVRLLRVIGNPALESLDPFISLAHFGSEDPRGYVRGFPDHPHRGFETVTYMIEGQLRHADNRGGSGVIGPGGAQWMTAGRGIVHSEMPEQRLGRMSGFQLWLNLPARDKMCDPGYRNLAPEDVPEVHAQDGAVFRVVAGTVLGVAGAVVGGATDPTFVDAELPPGAERTFEVEPGYNAFLYVFERSIAVGDGSGAATAIPAGRLGVLGDGDSVMLRGGPEGGRALFAAGRPLNEPMVQYGPFVMNTREEIVQAIHDYQSGRF